MAFLHSAIMWRVRRFSFRFVCFFTNNVGGFVIYVDYTCARDYVARASPRVSVCVGAGGEAVMGWR
jgi:hypothetical protein